MSRLSKKDRYALLFACSAFVLWLVFACPGTLPPFMQHGITGVLLDFNHWVSVTVSAHP